MILKEFLTVIVEIFFVFGFLNLFIYAVFRKMGSEFKVVVKTTLFQTFVASIFVLAFSSAGI